MLPPVPDNTPTGTGVCVVAACQQGISIIHATTVNQQTSTITNRNVRTGGLIPWMESSLVSAAMQGKSLAERIADNGNCPEVWVTIPDHVNSLQSAVGLGGFLAGIPKTGPNPTNIYEHAIPEQNELLITANANQVNDKQASQNLDTPCTLLVMHVAMLCLDDLDNTVQQITDLTDNTILNR